MSGSGTKTVTMRELSKSRRDCDSACANCHRPFASEAEKCTKVVGKYLNRVKNEVGEEAKQKRKEGDEDEDASMNEDGDYEVVGVLEALMTIYGSPQSHDENETDDVWGRGKGQWTLCLKCHEVLTAFYSAYRELRRLADDTSYLTEFIKSVGRDAGEKVRATEEDEVRPRRGRRGRRKKIIDDDDVTNEQVPPDNKMEVGVGVGGGDLLEGAEAMPGFTDDDAALAPVKVEVEVDVMEQEHGWELQGEELPERTTPCDYDSGGEVYAPSSGGSGSLSSSSCSSEDGEEDSEAEDDDQIEAGENENCDELSSEETSTATSSKVRNAKRSKSSPDKTSKKKKYSKNDRDTQTVRKQVSVPSSSETFNCKHCDEYCLTEKRLRRHLAIAHKETVAQSRCTVCDQLFPKVVDLAKHINDVHDRKYFCPECPTSSTSYSEMETHYQTVHNEAMNLCEECGKSFTSSDYLLWHSRSVHSDPLALASIEIKDGQEDDTNNTSEGQDGKEKVEPGERIKKVKSSSISGPRLKCNQCSKTFNRPHQLSLHMLTHSEKVARYGCSQCSETFQEPMVLRRHLVDHASANQLACSECDKVFLRRDHLKRHKKNVHGNNNFVRSTAPNPNPSQDELAHAMARSRFCLECNKIFSRPEHLKRHMKTMHDPNRPAPSKTPEETEYRCPECGKVFARREYLRTHIRRHSNERPYVCSKCGKGFVESSSLNAHLRTHETDRPYCCSTCGATFKLQSNLIEHAAVHNDDRPFCCSICGRTFKRGSTMRNHELTHRDDVPRRFVCSFPNCGKAFLFRKYLTKHEVMHKESRDFLCGGCGKAFLRVYNLRQHIRNVHKELAPGLLQQLTLTLQQQNQSESQSNASQSQQPLANDAGQAEKAAVIHQQSEGEGKFQE